MVTTDVDRKNEYERIYQLGYCSWRKSLPTFRNSPNSRLFRAHIADIEEKSPKNVGFGSELLRNASQASLILIRCYGLKNTGSDLCWKFFTLFNMFRNFRKPAEYCVNSEHGLRFEKRLAL